MSAQFGKTGGEYPRWPLTMEMNVQCMSLFVHHPWNNLHITNVRAVITRHKASAFVCGSKKKAVKYTSVADSLMNTLYCELIMTVTFWARLGEMPMSEGGFHCEERRG